MSFSNVAGSSRFTPEFDSDYCSVVVGKSRWASSHWISTSIFLLSSVCSKTSQAQRSIRRVKRWKFTTWASPSLITSWASTHARFHLPTLFYAHFFKLVLLILYCIAYEKKSKEMEKFSVFSWAERKEKERNWKFSNLLMILAGVLFFLICHTTSWPRKFSAVIVLLAFMSSLLLIHERSGKGKSRDDANERWKTSELD